MKQAMKPVWGLFAILVAVVAVNLVWKATRPAEIVPWRTNYAAALDEGRAQNKPVFLYFTADWCGPCQGLKHTTWADKGVEAALRDYVPVKVDVDEQGGVAAKYNVSGIPAYIVLDSNGGVVGNWSGAYPPAEFIDELKRVGTAVRESKG
jgi:thiol:disulfide interchange protein